MSIVNKIERISLSGGIIGLLTTNPRKALEDTINKYNKVGFKVVHFAEHKTTNMLVIIIQLVVLMLTLGLWTFGAGYMVLFEKETE